MMKRLALFLAVLLTVLSACASPRDPAAGITDTRTTAYEEIPRPPHSETDAASQTQPETDVITDQTTEPTTEWVTDPVTEPITEPITEPVTEPPAPVFEPFTLAFTGDVCIAENYKIHQNAVKMGYSLEDCFSPSILARMRAADLLLVNCESAVSDRGSPLKGKKFTFLTSTEAAKGFLTMGADLIGMANNHVYDYGKDAFLDTLDTFAALGLPTVGAGRNAAEAYTPFYYEKSGMKIAIIASSRAEKNYMTPIAEPDEPGIAGCYDTTLTCEAVKEAKKQADFVIVYAHFGAEYKTTIEAVQAQAARDFIDAGADLIIGAHPHILQGIEYYNGKPIFYSLGNYLFNMNEQDSALLEINFSSPSEAPTLHIVPCRQTGGRIVDVTDTDEGTKVLNGLRKLSKTVTISDDGFVTEKE